MKTTSLKIVLLLAVVLTLAASCSKTEGEGGTSSIVGTVHVTEVDKDTRVYLRDYPAKEQRVYITYGDNTGYDDVVRTHHDGTYKFNFLHEGDYSLYAYSDCDSCAGGVSEVKINVQVGKGADVDAPVINVVAED